MQLYSSTCHLDSNRICPRCGLAFHVPPSYIKEGRGKFCSHKCFLEADNIRRAALTIARFWDKVEKTTGCWIWKGARLVRGYGTLKIQKRPLYAHRLAYLLHYGYLPDNLLVCHHCDNPSCVNPAHLFLGTLADNNRDMVKKGRNVLPPLSGRVAPKGESSPRAKLTNGDVLTIRARFAAGKVTKTVLARQFGIDHGHCVRIINRQVWKHI